MKKVILLITFVIITVATRQVFAQDQTTTSLIVSSYSSKADLDFLFKNSAVVLKYLEGTEIDKPIFLSLVTPVQRLLIQKHGLPVTTIDEAPDISRYKLLFTYESNKSDLLKPFGDVFPLTPHHTLIRFPSGTTDDILHSSQARFDVEFFDSPFMGALPSPKYQTATITLAPTKSTAANAAPATTQNPPSPRSALASMLIVFIIVGILISTAIFIVILRKRRYS